MFHILLIFLERSLGPKLRTVSPRFGQELSLCASIGRAGWLEDCRRVRLKFSVSQKLGLRWDSRAEHYSRHAMLLMPVAAE
jgi:hypothetical protein